MDDIWNVLKEYDFLLTNVIIIDFVCILCKKILIDARVGPCGCRFCKICIENYLENGENICPGSTEECEEEKLNLIENINIDHFINKKIAKLKINCPIENCIFSDEIINMKQHLISCREIAVKCSFSENGCKFFSLSGDNVDKHCKMSKDKHLELVLSKINSMNTIKNELQENENLKKEKDKVKESLKQNQTSIDQLNTQIAIQTKQIDDYKSNYENEINNKIKLIKYLSDCLIGSQTEFVWKIDKFSQMKSSPNSSIKSNKFFIHKKDIWMELSMVYYGDTNYNNNNRSYLTNYRYILSGNVSHYNKLLNSSCPFICDITLGIVNEISGNLILNFIEKKTFNSSDISFKNEIAWNEIDKEVINDCLTVKCLIKLSL